MSQPEGRECTGRSNAYPLGIMGSLPAPTNTHTLSHTQVAHCGASTHTAPACAPIRLLFSIYNCDYSLIVKYKYLFLPLIFRTAFCSLIFFIHPRHCSLGCSAGRAIENPEMPHRRFINYNSIEWSRRCGEEFFNYRKEIVSGVWCGCGRCTDPIQPRWFIQFYIALWLQVFLSFFFFF